MKFCRDEAELRREYESVVRLSERSFGSGSVFHERFIQRGRHVEVQVFGDGNGRVLALGERDCSVQRRNQKVFEETPAPGITDGTRASLQGAAAKLCESVDYRSAGTVEFIYDADRDDFYFLEVNTRLQVEHGITEMVTGIDLVEWMVRLALDDRWQMPERCPVPQGCAIQARVYAEDPNHNFRPSCGLLTEAKFPEWTRCDGWVLPGTEVSPFYDPLLAKVMVHAVDRAGAVAKIGRALEETRISGIETNLRYLRDITRWQPYLKDGVAMREMADFIYQPRTIDVIAAGAMTTVRDWPGRTGYWEVGVPPCGPFDSLSFRLANRLVGNEEGVAGLEITMTGPTLRFNIAATIAVVGAPATPRASGKIPVLVCGAHMEGLALHGQLADRGAVLREKTRTAPVYRMYALPASGSIPPRPALIRDEGAGAAIDVEIWELEPAAFGDFVAKIPGPLGIGKVLLESGEEVPGFIAEPRATEGAEEITRLGGWRPYVGRGGGKSA